MATGTCFLVRADPAESMPIFCLLGFLNIGIGYRWRELSYHLFHLLGKRIINIPAARRGIDE